MKTEILHPVERKMLARYCQALAFNNEALAVMFAVLLAKARPKDRELALKRATNYLSNKKLTN